MVICMAKNSIKGVETFAELVEFLNRHLEISWEGGKGVRGKRYKGTI